MSNLSSIIFGTGKGGERTFRHLRGETQVLAFADNDEVKWGSRFHGKEVISPDRIAELAPERILIASSRGYEIRRQLIGLGLAEKILEIVPTPVLLGEYDVPSGWHARFLLGAYWVIAPIALILALVCSCFRPFLPRSPR